MIGSHLAISLHRLGHDVHIIDNLWRGHLSNIEQYPDFPIENIHICDMCDIRVGHFFSDVDTVFHLADIVAGINFVFDNQFFLWKQNMLINSNCINLAISHKVKNYIYVGTACSYPKKLQSFHNPPPFKEEDVFPAEPESSYGWSKLMGEYECELASSAEQLSNVGILRLHNVYGPNCTVDPHKSQVIPALCLKALNYPSNDFVVWGSGNQSRAFVYVDDVVSALLACLDRGMNKGPIQIGPSSSTSISDIAQHVKEISGKDFPIIYDLSKPEGDTDRCADYSKARELLGWEPATTIREGLSKTYEWISNKII